MFTFGPAAREVLADPGAFALRCLKAFKANQGLLLAGAVAYYALLSIVPLLILTVIALSHLIDQQELLATLGRYLEWLVPGQSRMLIAELSQFLAHRGRRQPAHRPLAQGRDERLRRRVLEHERVQHDVGVKDERAHRTARGPSPRPCRTGTAGIRWGRSTAARGAIPSGACARAA